MSAQELIEYLQNAIDAGKGNNEIVIVAPDDLHTLEIKSAHFWQYGVDTSSGEDVSEAVEIEIGYKWG